MSVQIADIDTKKKLFIFGLLFLKKIHSLGIVQNKICVFFLQTKGGIFFFNYYNLCVKLFCFDWSRIFDDSRRRWRNDWK